MRKVFLIFLITGIFFCETAFAEKFRLACKVRAFDLEGTAFTDKVRFYNSVINLDVDTEVGVYSPDLKNETTDEVILHGLWPKTEFLDPKNLQWQNELLISDGKENSDPWLMYRYETSISPSNKNSENILKIRIKSYKRYGEAGSPRPPLKRLVDVKNKAKEDYPGEYVDTTFNFRFNCEKTSVF